MCARSDSRQCGARTKTPTFDRYGRAATKRSPFGDLPADRCACIALRTRIASIASAPPRVEPRENATGS